jgi:hypothetical protein
MAKQKTKQPPSKKILHPLRKAIIVGVATGIVVFFILALKLIISPWNYSFGGNAQISNSTTSVWGQGATPNTEGHAFTYLVASDIAVIAVPVVSAVLVARWRYHRYSK